MYQLCKKQYTDKIKNGGSSVSGSTIWKPKYVFSLDDSVLDRWLQSFGDKFRRR